MLVRPASVGLNAEKVSASSAISGLVVIVGENEPMARVARTATFGGVGDGCLVHALYTDGAVVADDRRRIRQAGAAGRVTVSLFDGENLPFVDNVVNVVIVSDDRCQVSGEEMARVLAPRGMTAFHKRPKVMPPGLSAIDTRGMLFDEDLFPYEKLVPDDIDEWTHFLHGPDNNAVARDKRIGVPRRMQWVDGPKWARHHNHLSSVSAAVSSEGRIFAIVDEGPIASLGLPPRWRLVAHDAFNGIVLWKRRIGPWEGQMRPFRSGPTDIARRLVAVGDRVYVTPGYMKPVEALDAGTGKTLTTYKGTEGTQEILCDGDALYVLTGERNAQMFASSRATRKAAPHPVNKRLLCIERDTGQVRWQRDDSTAGNAMPCTLCVAGGRVFFHSPGHLVCADAATGKTVWQQTRTLRRSRPHWSTPTLVVSEGVVLSADCSAKQEEKGEMKWAVTSSPRRGDPMGELIAFAADDGRELWRCPTAVGYTAPPDVFVVDGLVWTGRADGHNTTDFTQGRDLRTGEVKRRLDTAHAFDSAHHHRCYRNKATEDFILLGRTGVEFIDLSGKQPVRNCWVRGACQYGVVPANGLLYAAPHACACYIQSKLSGFWALAAGEGNEGRSTSSSDEARLEEGQGFGSPIRHSTIGNRRSGDWPTFRHDPARSGATPMQLPAILKRAWTVELGGRLSSPVVAGGKALIASTDAHTVHALDAETGRRLWDFAAGGRVDSPPTVHGGRVLFGSADGHVYCLRLSDGALEWRYLAAPADRRTVSFGQIESVWPVTGSVLVYDGMVHCTAGRSSYLDGGMVLCRLDPATGKEVSRTVLNDRDPATGHEPEDRIEDVELPGALPDVLVGDGEFVYLRDRRFDSELKEHPPTVPHLYCSAGLLDDSWWHRTYWLWGERTFGRASGWHVIPNHRPSGRILVTDEKTVFGYGRKSVRYVGHTLAGCHLFRADKRVTPIQKKLKNNNKALVAKLTPARVHYRWTREVPLHVRALVLAGEELVAAGPGAREEVAFDDASAQAALMVFSAADGSTKTRCDLPAQPVFDGMAAAHDRLYIATIGGELLCFGGDAAD